MSKKRTTLISLSFILVLLAALTGCQRQQEPISKTGFYFDTVITVTLYDASATKELEECFDMAKDYENMLSATVEGSDIWNINHANGETVAVSDETAALIEKAISYSQLSDGAFDITIGQLSSLWNFKENDGTIPSEEQIKTALASVGYQNIVVDHNSITLTNPGTQIDLGGIAKGYIADQMKAYLNENGITEGVIDLGGNILTVGPKENADSYRIGIQKPFADTGTSIAAVEIHDDSLVSSGIYERYFKKDGAIYHHILNPRTGYPYDNGLTAVTIRSDSSLTGDALSTTVFALGEEKGLELLNRLPDVEGFVVREDLSIHPSKNFS